MRIGSLAVVLTALVSNACSRQRAPEQPADTVRASTYAAAVAIASSAASRPYAAPDAELPPALRSLTYDDYRAIRYRPEETVSVGDKFGLQFFHRGYGYTKKVTVHLQPRTGVAHEVAYDGAAFIKGEGLASAQLPADLGFAGFRVHYAFDKASPKEEFLVFQGASYFRLIGHGNNYGLSARGVAVDTGIADREEFPDFTTFWVVEPEPGQRSLTIVALLDGPSITGAFRFDVTPGDTSRMHVETTLFTRKPIERLGLAPLTSMYLHGPQGPRAVFDDYRPQVHDSDGLLLHTPQEVALRPLMNKRRSPRVSSFAMPALDSFGLMQRERSFAAYLDVAARHEARPSMLVHLRGPWPKGSVQLYEIPADEEYMDNIVAYFAPAASPRVGETFHLAYDIETVTTEPPSDVARVVGTRTGSVEQLRPSREPHPGRRLYVVDFEGPALPKEADAWIDVNVIASSGTIVDPVTEYVVQTGGRRLYFEHRPDGDAPVELRATLAFRGRQVSETWLFAP